MYHIILFFLCLFLTAFSAHANILNVPEDHETIQQGLNTSEDGDTILVQEGRYVENLVFPNDHSVVLASMRLFEEDDDIIERTVIDGNRDGSVITVDMENEAPVTIIGFTITNGRNHEFGGGLFCSGANLMLQNLLINDNSAGYGGAMYLANSSISINDFTFSENHGDRSCNYLAGGVELTMIDGLVTNNYASRGGAFYSVNDRNRIFLNRVTFIDDSTKDSGSFFYGENAEVILDRVLIAKSAGWYFGLIYAHNCEFDFNFVTITGNRTYQVASDVHFDRCAVSFRNSIARHNRWEEGLNISNANSEISASYSTGILGFNDGEGIIRDDPLFVDFENNDFRLSPGSPCIDAGDPESDLDPDGTRADMGMYPLFRPVYLHGSIFRASDNGAIENARIELSTGERTSSHENGLWSTNTIPGDVDITFAAYGCLDSTIHVENFGAGDTLEFETGLLHPELIPDYNEIIWDLVREDSAQVVVTLTNPGDVSLSWNMEIQDNDSTAPEPWDSVGSYPVYEITGDNDIRGVVRKSGLTYLSGDGDEPPMIYVINDNGELVNQFRQPVEDPLYIRGMTWGEDKIWGVASYAIVGFDTDGNNVEVIETNQIIRSDIAYDPVRELFWAVYSSSNIVGIDRNGREIEFIPNDDYRIFSIACNDRPENGFCLIAIGLDDHGNRIVIQINPETEELRRIATLRNIRGISPFGAFIGSGFSDRNSLRFMYIESADVEMGGDRLDMYHLDNDFFWISSNISDGFLEPGSSNQILLELRTIENEQDFILPYGVYQAELNFDLETVNTEFHLPVTMNVVHPDHVNSEEYFPETFGITSISPNPFNSTTCIAYNLSLSGNVRLSIHDIQGREIAFLQDGMQVAGQQSVNWKADGQPSGLYLCRIESGGQVATGKLILVK